MLPLALFPSMVALMPPALTDDLIASLRPPAASRGHVACVSQAPVPPISSVHLGNMADIYSRGSCERPEYELLSRAVSTGNAMSNLSHTTASFLPEPTPMASVKPCRHSSDLERQYGNGFALSARCSR